MPNTEKDQSISISKQLEKEGVKPDEVNIVYSYCPEMKKGRWQIKKVKP